jgi:tetrapyrrole methylase family protein/MazG family protein
VKIIRLGRPPYSSDLLENLRQAEAPLYHADPSQEGFHALTQHGLVIEPLGDEVSVGTLLLPRSTGPLERLVGIVDRLLGPGGCPWDQAQTHESLKRYLLEESYELFEAIEQDNKEAMEEELGDVLLQPLLHSAMLSRDGFSNVDAVANHISDKLVRRHPHVFGTTEVAGVDEVLSNWDSIKKAEKKDENRSVLAGVPKALPSLLRAYEVSKRAARQGFEWSSIAGVWEKFDEETLELKSAIVANDKVAVESELGDLLFTVVNLARWLGVEPELALATMVNRFQRRFELMESLAEAPLSTLSPDAWETLWQEVKLQLASEAST